MISFKKKKNPLFFLVLLVFSVPVFAAGMAASAAAFVSPVSNWVIALFGVAFPFIYLINLIFLIVWLIRRQWPVWLHVLVFFIGFKTAGYYWAWSGKPEKADAAGRFSVLSFNVRNFDFYNWSGNYYGYSDLRGDIFKLIRQLNPDIICFQEFFHSDTGKFRTIQYLVDSLGYKNHFIRLPVNLYKYHHWGMAVFSRYPITDKYEIKFPKPGHPRKKSNINLCLRTEINIRGKTVTVYNAHFQSIMFGPKEYRMALNPELNIRPEEMGRLKQMVLRMKNAFELRTLQIEKAAESIKTERHPVILCADLNDTPAGWAYRQIINLLQDSFLTKGRGLGITYIGPFPAMRIDFVFYSESLECVSQQVIRKKLSDHYPQYAVFRFKE